ncbi:MAG: chromosome segregation SMC family protein [Candidatus Bilamarchaeaceae archaeon]
MIRISHLKLRNFKSFKHLNLEFPPGMICFAGPNGSGKSNINDSIMFALGETSLKSLRAKKVKDLIHVDSKTAEVWLRFDGDEKYEIKRAIRDDGKIIYRLNGKRTTRTSIIELLKKYNLDTSGRNIIAQGEVQRIAEMSGKERREIIDAVAGISDFEQKKKEALSELAVVDGRINEANIVLGERLSFLAELQKERDIAIRYKEAKDNLDGARAALVKMELEKSKKELEKSETQKKELEEKIKALQKEMEKNNEEISNITKQKAEITNELQKKQKSAEEIKRIEELKAKIVALEEKIREKKETLEKLKEESEELEKILEKEREKIKDIENSIKTLEYELEKKEKVTKKEKIEENEEITKTKSRKEEINAELQSLREKNASLAAENKARNEQVQMLKKQLEELSAIVEEKKEYDLEKIKAERDGLNSRIEELFQQTKEINKRIAELEKEMLELKEKISIYRVRFSPQLVNPGLKIVEDMKKSDRGIYGTVADLIQFDSTMAKAVEAAGGGRLLYVVVDSADTAIRIIEKLKKERAGRVTFIPLSTIRTNEPRSIGGFESIITKIKYPAEVRKAIEYVFGDTILIKDHEDAKKIGMGKCRMVTYAGEIYEISGTIAGGFSESGLLTQNQLKKLEDAFATAKKEKDDLTQQLYAIREEEAELRARKSRLEVEIKTIEAEKKQKENILEQNKKKKQEIEQQIKNLYHIISNGEDTLKKIQERITALTTEEINILEKLEKMEKEEKQRLEAAHKKATEDAEEISRLRATINGRKKEHELLSQSYAEKEQRYAQIKKEIAVLEKEIKESIEENEQKRKRLADEEENLKTKGKQIEQLFEEIRKNEQKLQEIGGRNDLLKREIAALDKEIGQLEIKKATAITKISDLEVEIQKYSHVKILAEQTKQRLTEIINENEKILNEIGTNVNLAAIEMFAKKEAEIKEVKEKIDQLTQERDAIIKMINEIEEHKKEAFFEAFNKISDNFKKIFSYVNIGTGYLMLDKPNDPFESGLYIRMKRGNHEYALDSLSGGERTLVSLIFIFALQLFKPAPFYVLDEVDAALDRENSKRMAELIKQMSKDSQFIVVSHNETLIANADVVFGVTKVGDTSEVAAVKLEGIPITK